MELRRKTNLESSERVWWARVAGLVGALAALATLQGLRTRGAAELTGASRTAPRSVVAGGRTGTDIDALPGLPSRKSARHAVASYAVGFLIAGLLTAASFSVAQGNFFYGPTVPFALIALAVAQIGAHVVFFLHINTGPDHLNNVLALLFGIFVILLVILGSIWIMSHLNHMMPHGAMTNH